MESIAVDVPLLGGVARTRDGVGQGLYSKSLTPIMLGPYAEVIPLLC